MSQQVLPLREVIMAQPGDVQMTIKSMAENLEREVYKIPHYQRDFVWENAKISSWAETIITHKASGSILIYQVVGDGSEYICDGMQRLTATVRFMNNPEDYGFTFDSDEARNHCDKFSYTAQRRIFKNHDEAFEHFQRLNYGTQPIAADYYKGELTKNSTGRWLWEEIPRVVNDASVRGHCNDPMNNETGKMLGRDSFGLFYQYVTGSTIRKFWDTQARKIKLGASSIEARLSAYASEKSVDELRDEIGSFRKFLIEYAILVVAIKKQSGIDDAIGMSPALWRFLMHTAIWRKNAKRPVSKYKELVTGLFDYLSAYTTLSSRFTIKKDGQEKNITLHTGSITSLKTLCDFLDVQDFYEEGITRKKVNTLPGYDRSHKKSIAMGGSDEDKNVFYEPAPLNRARGGNSIS